MVDFQKRNIVGALPTGTNILGSFKITNGTYTVTVDASGRMETSVLSLKPDGTNAMPSMDVAARAGYTYVTDGTNTMPTMDDKTRRGFVQICDDDSNAAVIGSCLQTVITNASTGARADVQYGSSDNLSTANQGLVTLACLHGFNETTWTRLRSDTNNYLYTTIGVELPAGTQLIGSVKISDGTETASVNPDNELNVNTTDKLITITADYAGAETDTTVLTPTVGKKIEIHQVYVSTAVTNVDVIVDFGTSGNIIHKLYTSNFTAAASATLHMVGATNEVVRITCGAGTFVAITYHEID